MSTQAKQVVTAVVLEDVCPGHKIYANGSIKRLDTGVQVAQYNLNGYLYVSLKNPAGKHTMRLVHRLVAMAFIDLPAGTDEDSMTVDHIDFDPTNNDVSNLRWITHSANCARKKAGGRTAPVHITVSAGDTSLSFSRRETCAKFFNCSTKTVDKFLRGIRQHKIRGWEVLACVK